MASLYVLFQTLQHSDSEKLCEGGGVVPLPGKGGGKTGAVSCSLCGWVLVRVWAIPSLNSMQDEVMIYEKGADLSLVLGEKVVGQCLALSWYRGSGLNYIAASFSSVWSPSGTQGFWAFSLSQGRVGTQVPDHWGQ